MTDHIPFLAATDKDVFDLLMSSKTRMSESALLSIALGRGIIYSSRTKRERLASDIALLPHDFLSISRLIERREYHNKNEKRAYVDIDVALTHEKIDDVVSRYRAEVSGQEDVTTQQRRTKDVYVNIAYDDIDYSKTRLIQRQRRDTGVEFVIGDGKTTIRMPATEKARSIVDRIIRHASQIKLRDLLRNDLSLEGLSAEERTAFFINIMRTIPGYQLQTVVSVKCFSERDDISDDFDLDMERGERAAENELVGKINSVALSGMNLLQSEEYQTLRRNGFFITSVTWRALQVERPHDLLQLDISFDEPQPGKGFRFGVRVARRLADGELTNDFRPLERLQQPALWTIIERTSSKVLAELRSSQLEQQSSAERGAGA
ncbi:MAG: hypothetical protein E5Y67_07090 [Mesorhizobium sp.]|uniref:hypothetical protein n=1 Tax=Mesorhizobium sp. TaxID=1871066 RepID=UPI0012194E20|nr:hypothetical protein [Mesorhizobium sp.]TIM15506.1 MAG: hypothetical protein E5Y67_07090 [Mesorhizobium sp.]